VTVRIWATGLDYVLDSDDQVMRGSRDTPRTRSEDWTLIRSRDELDWVVARISPAA
jgi:hypothetical protein